MIKKIFLVLVVLLQIFSMANAADIRFIQVTGVQYSPDNSEKLCNCIRDINSIPKLDFVIFTGDNIASARKENLKGFLNTVKKLHAPVYIIIGDRDVSKEKGLNKDAYREAAFKTLGLGQSLKPNYVFKKKGFIFIAVDGAKEFVTAPNGYYKQETVDWLNKQLAKYKNKKVIIFQHFPIIDSDDTLHNTYKAQMYRSMLALHGNVIGIVSGHFRYNEEQVINGVMHIITPSYSDTGEYKIFDIPAPYDCIYTQLRKVDLL